MRDQERRERAADSRRQPERRLRPLALLDRQPVVKTRVRFGNAPASPAPNSARMATSDETFQAQPVAAVKKDHQRTMRIRTRRGPMRSPSQPPGNLEDRVGPAERRQRPAHLRGRQAEILCG